MHVLMITQNRFQNYSQAVGNILLDLQICNLDLFLTNEEPAEELRSKLADPKYGIFIVTIEDNADLDIAHDLTQ